MDHPTPTHWTRPLIRRAMVAAAAIWLVLWALAAVTPSVGRQVDSGTPLLAFVANPGSQEAAIYLVDTRGGALRWQRVPGMGESLAASPDGQWLAFTIVQAGRHSLDLLNWQTGEQRRLFEGDAGASRIDDPRWSPDGQWLVYSHVRQGGEIVAHNVDTGERRTFTQDAVHDQSPAWSPDGSQIAYISRLDDRDVAIDLADFVTGQTRRLVDLAANGFIPAWSPDGRWLAYVAVPNRSSEVYMVEVATGLPQRLTDEGMADHQPAWSPDGERLAFVSNRANLSDVYVMDMQTGQVRGFGNHLHMIGQPTWSPDSRWIAFSCIQGNHYRLGLVDTHTGETRLLTRSETRISSPTWLP